MIKNVHICFLSGFFPNSIYKEILSASTYNMQHAANKLQQSFLAGLSFYYPDLYIINAPFVGSFPKRYNRLFVPKATIVPFKGTSMGFLNLTGIKQPIIKRKITRELTLWVNKLNGEQAIVIVYALITSRMEAVINIKKRFPNVKIIQIVPDLVQFMGIPSGRLYHYYYRKNCVRTPQLVKEIDAFILLSKYMARELGIEHKPHDVIEGIVSDLNTEVNSSMPKFPAKTILYTGTLAERYGVMNLVHAFMLLNDADSQLIICGSGDSESEIKELSVKCPNIVFKGSISNQEALDLQKRASLLVNPRTPEGDFTRFSFPSKTIEYFQSGTPTLLYRLPGIPEEYYQYCFSIEQDFSVEFLSKTLEKILSLSHKELCNKGEMAKQFVLKNKNAIKQVEKIKNIIEIELV